jgi:hypothetical protein
MAAVPPGQSAILAGGYSPWQAPLAALFSGIGAAGQPGGWANFSQGVQGGLQNFQNNLLAQEQSQRARESFQMDQERFEDEQRRANQAAEQEKARIEGITNLLSPKPIAAPTAGTPLATMFGGKPTEGVSNQSALFGDYAGIPPHARQSAMLSGYPEEVLKRGMEPDGTINLDRAGGGGLGNASGLEQAHDGTQHQGANAGQAAGGMGNPGMAPADDGMEILGFRYSAEQVAALRSMPPLQAEQILMQNAFAQPKERKTTEIAGRLVDAQTGEVIRDLSAEEIALRQASRPQTILSMPGNPTPDEIGRGAFAEANAKSQAAYFDEVAKAGATAQTRLGDVNQLVNLIETTPQGAGQEWINKGAAVLGRFGVDTTEFANVPAAQAFQSIVSRIAPTLRVSGSGATSDFEMQQFLASLPAIGNMPGGNRIIANNLKKISERSVQEANIAAQVQGGDLTPAEGRKKILALGPLDLDLPTFSGPPAGGPGGAPGAPSGATQPLADDPLGLFAQ